MPECQAATASDAACSRAAGLEAKSGASTRPLTSREVAAVRAASVSCPVAFVSSRTTHRDRRWEPKQSQRQRRETWTDPDVSVNLDQGSNRDTGAAEDDELTS